MANTKTQMAEGIASLVRGQRFAGSGVWRQSGNATLRIQNQTQAIVNALGRLPTKETQEEEERESDRQHEELVGAIESSNLSSSASSSASSSTRGFGKLLGKNSALFKVFGAISKGSKGIAGLIGGGLLKGIGLLFKAIRFVGLIPLGLAGLIFFSKSPEEQKEIIDSIFGFFNSIGNFLKDFGADFKKGFASQGKLDTKELSENFRLLSDRFENIFEDIEFTAFGSKHKGIAGIANALGMITFHLTQGFIDLSNAVIKFALDPGASLGELKGTMSANIKIIGIELSKVFKDIFSYRSIIRQLESIGFGFLIPSSAYRAAAKEQKTDLTKELNEVVDKQSIYAGFVAQRQIELDELPTSDVLGRKNKQAALTRARIMSDFFGNRRKEIMNQLTTEQGEIKKPGEMSAAQKMGAFDFKFSLPSLLKGLGDYTLRVIDDTGRLLELSNNAIRDALLPSNLVPVGGGDPALFGGGNVYADNSTNVNKSEVIINDTRTRGENVSGASDSKNRGGKN